MTLPHFAESGQALFTDSNIGYILQSNQLENLLEELKNNINKTVPKKISILVENSAIKSYIQKTLTHYSGIDFTEPAQFDPFLRYRIDKEIAEVFHLYAKYGDTALEEWLLEPNSAPISDQTHTPLQSPLTTQALYQQHVRRSVPLRAEEIHLFHPTHLPKWYLDPLFSRNPRIQLFIYILSPSPLFLFDLVKEKHLLQDEMEGVYIDDQYRLLANLIPYKLPLLKIAEQYALKTTDAFIEPIGSSSLSILKRNLYFQETTPIEPDASLCTIPATTPLEEVQNCFAFIYELLKNHRELRPSDITLLADLKTYGPLLEFVFDQKLALQIDQVPIFRFDPSMKNFYRLFALFDSRWTIQELKPLFIEEPLDLWLEDAGFSLGYSSFLHAFDALVERMATTTGLLPFPISLMQPLLTLKNTLAQLYIEIQTLKTATMPLEAWLEKLKTFFCTYLHVFDNHPFFDELTNYQPLMSDEPKDFPFIRQLLFDLFESLKGPLMLGDGDRVRASNIKEGAILPNKVLFVLGMNLKQFPGYRPLSPLYAIQKLPPPQGVIDRYKFLEILLMAKERLIFSYSGNAPSTLIEEIFRST